MVLRRTKVFSVIIIIVFLFPAIHATRAENNPQNASQFVNKDVTISTDLHYTNKYCDECHEKTPEKGGNKYLRFGGDFTQLCRCHGYTSSSYIHPVDIEPSEEKKTKMPKDFPLQNGKITCLTCHDMYKQCQYNQAFQQTSGTEKTFRSMEMMFLRGSPYKSRTDICFKCHDEKKYKKLDPHNQLTENREIIVEKCLYCHVEKPDEKTATFQDVKLIGDLTVLCQRCHGVMDRHPAGINHLRKPSAKALKRINRLEIEFYVILPLDYEGKITCTTCHNPHEKGVIKAERSGAKGAGERYRHRLPKILCEACHGM